MPKIDDNDNPFFDPNLTDESIVEEIDASNEKEYLREIKKKNKGFLVEDLSILERERIAQYIVDRFNEVKTKHDELADKIDEWDDVYYMRRKEVQGSNTSEMPNYRSPISTVTLETIHANIMNVLFTPKDVMRVLPTEEGDIGKVQKLGVFGNWSTKNELDLFTQCDRLFHSSGKTGEAPYIMHWVKEYGTEIVRKNIPNPQDPSQPLIDPDTQEPVYQEVEEQKLLYNAPKLEPFSRKDYFQPLNALMDKLPDWEMRRIRFTYDDYLREELQGKMYSGSIKDIMDWGGSDSDDTQKMDYEGDTIPVGKFTKEFMEFYGRLRINIIKRDAEDEIEDEQELEEECRLF